MFFLYFSHFSRFSPSYCTILNGSCGHHSLITILKGMAKQIKSLWRLLILSYLKKNCHIFFLLLLPHIWNWMSILLSTIQWSKLQGFSHFCILLIDPEKDGNKIIYKYKNIIFCHNLRRVSKHTCSLFTIHYLNCD
jgi:hypothetical protein